MEGRKLKLFHSHWVRTALCGGCQFPGSLSTQEVLTGTGAGYWEPASTQAALRRKGAAGAAPTAPVVIGHAALTASTLTASGRRPPQEPTSRASVPTTAGVGAEAVGPSLLYRLQPGRSLHHLMLGERRSERHLPHTGAPFFKGLVPTQQPEH